MRFVFLAAVGLAFALGGSIGNARNGAVPVGKVAYVHTRGNVSWIEVANLDGSAKRALTPRPPPGSKRMDIDPEWSPDGDVVAFDRTGVTASQAGVFIVRSDGTGLKRVASSRLYAGVWSPDGRMLASDGSLENRFGCIQRQTDAIIDIVDIDGLGQRRLRALPRSGLGPEPTFLSSLSWSPDGRRIAFVEDDWDSGDCGRGFPSSSVHVIGVDGRGRRRLVSRTNPILGHLAWSQDGTRIAFAELGLDGGVYVASTNRSAVAVLWQPNGEQEARDALWGPDDREVLFMAERGVFSVDVRTRTARRLMTTGTSVELFFLARSRDGSLVAFEGGVVSADGNRRWRIPFLASVVGSVYLS